MNAKRSQRRRILSSGALLTFLSCVCLIGREGALASDTESTMETELKTLVKTWEESLPRTVSASFPEKEAFDENEYCHKIVSMGPSVVPLIIEAGQSRSAVLRMAEMICKRRFEWHVDREATTPGKPVYIYEDLPGYDRRDLLPRRRSMWLYWWNEVREQTPELFAGLYEEWKALRDEGKTEEAAKKLESIKNLGLDALPSVMEAVAAGDKDMVPVAAYLADVPWITGEKASDAMTCDECVAWWNAGKAHYAMPPFEKIVVEEKAGSDDTTAAAQ